MIVVIVPAVVVVVVVVLTIVLITAIDALLVIVVVIKVVMHVLSSSFLCSKKLLQKTLFFFTWLPRHQRQFHCIKEFLLSDLHDNLSGSRITYCDFNAHHYLLSAPDVHIVISSLNTFHCLQSVTCNKTKFVILKCYFLRRAHGTEHPSRGCLHLVLI